MKASRQPVRRFRARAHVVATAIAACFVAVDAAALPVGPQVVSGSASVSQTGNVLTVTNSNGAILHWQQFNIGAGETTHFAQPSASSAVLNRVLSADPSTIYGTLSSNGKVWLVNPAGIMVGPGARIDVAGFVASTLAVSNQDFLAGKLNFSGAGGAGNVVNQGTITTPQGGSVYLVGGNVSNEGLIATPGGETILAAGSTVQLIDSASPGVKVEITGAAGNATNLGEIVAEAGRIGIAGVIVRNSGTLNASSVVDEGGRIFLKASQDAYVDGAGRIVTTGRKGGGIDVLGQRVAVRDQASLDASGDEGGGRIRVGGDYQGANAEVPNAQITYVGKDAELKANATKVGAGGTAIVWADDTTRAYGRIEARGVDAGGLVETSGKRQLDVAGIRVNTTAGDGGAGTWLLDPTDIVIYSGGSSASYGLNAGSNVFEFYGSGSIGTSYVSAADISSNLATTDVLITTNNPSGTGYGDITLSSFNTITNTSGVVRKLTFSADRHINVQYGASISGASGSALNVYLNAGTSNAAGTLTMAGTLLSYGGDVVLKAPAAVSIGDGVNTGYGKISARVDGVLAPTGADIGNGGRILIGASNGTFTMRSGTFIGTSNNSTMLDASGNNVGRVAIGILAGDVAIDASAAINLVYGGGDLGFIPTFPGTIGLGNATGAGFTLDNTELSRLMLPGGNACATTNGCRTWIGNIAASTDPLIGVLPTTTQTIVAVSADFTNNGTTPNVGKRVHLATTGAVYDQGSGSSFGIKAGHLAVTGSVIGELGGDGAFGFYGNSLLANGYGGGAVNVKSVGSGDLALRNLSGGTVTVSAAGNVVLLPFWANQSVQTTGNFDLSTSNGSISFAQAGSMVTVAGSVGTPITETAPVGATLRIGGNATLRSGATGGINVAGDHVSNGAFSLYGGSGGISLLDSGIAAQSGPVWMEATGDLLLSGLYTGTIVKTNGAITLKAANITLSGGSNVNSSTAQRFVGSSTQEGTGYQGANVRLSNNGTLNIQASGTLSLSAGSANNADRGGDIVYGGSVIVQSAGLQTINANTIWLDAGTAGHDNAVQVGSAFGQSVTVGAGGMRLRGGGAASGVYGGASAGAWSSALSVPVTTLGSYNNLARFSVTDNAVGSQTFTFNNGGSLLLQAGSGTGINGWNDCTPACASGNNSAEIRNTGNGSQTLSFTTGAALTLYGGSAGVENGAMISNDPRFAVTSQTILGNPDIALYGGSGGGSLANLGNNGGVQGNAATIEAFGFNQSSGGLQNIHARNIVINGGSGLFTPAGLIAASQFIDATGNVTLNGGGSNRPAGSSQWQQEFAGAALIGIDDALSSQTLNIGGNLALNGGSGSAGIAAIGSVNRGASISGAVVGALTLTAGTAPVVMGSLARSGNDFSSVTMNLGSLSVTSGVGKASIVVGSALGTLPFGMTALSGDIWFSAGNNLTSTGAISLKAAGNLALQGMLDAGTSALGLFAGYDGSAHLATAKTLAIGANVRGGAVTASSSGSVSTYYADSGSSYGYGYGYLRGNAITLFSKLGALTAGNGPAIYASTETSGSLVGSVQSGAVNGGIAVVNSGSPTSVSLNDGATYAPYSTGTSTDAYGATVSYTIADPSIQFYNFGNLSLGAASGFVSSNGAVSVGVSGDALIGSGVGFAAPAMANVPTTLTYPYASYIDVYASGSLNVSANLSTPADVTLYSGGTLTQSGSVTSTAGWASLYSGETATVYGSVTGYSGASVYSAGAALIDGGQISATGAYGSVDIGGVTSVKLDNGARLYSPATPVSYTGSASYGGVIDSYSWGGVTIWSQGPVIFNNGSRAEAPNGDVMFMLYGTTPRLVFNESAGMAASYVLASPNTIRLVLPEATSTSGVVVMDGSATMASAPGGSGFFVGSRSTPATAGAGLLVSGTYLPTTPPPGETAQAQQTVSQQTVLLNQITEQASTASNTASNPNAIPPATGGSTGTSLAATGQTVGGGEGTFGETQEGSDKKDANKDDKKASADENTNGKNDEKSSDKKAAQCS